MKRYEQVVQGSFEAYQIVRGVEITDFTIACASFKPMHITIYLHYNNNPQVEKTELVLKEGTKWELTAKVAKWLNSADFDGIRTAFEAWKELDADV